MLFNSLTYLLFLVVVVVAYWAFPGQLRKWLILVASLIFYGAWRVEFVFLIVFSAFVDYFFSLKIYDASRRDLRRLWLLCSLSINLGLLIYFKYTYFIVDNIALVGGLVGHDWKFSVGKIVLPLGISFYTFLSISYTLDVYRRLFVPIRNFGVYLTYVMFWPHMIAGPILRAHELLTQIVRAHHFNADHVAEGLKKILIGLFLKVALADQLAPFVDDAFSTAPSELGGVDVWTMAFAFGFQIYFDFAGYSLIAIGSARLLGIWFPENFDWPYMATSPRDFWKRWHITLSSWIRDYLYLPLSGRQFRDRSEGGIDIQVVNKKTINLTVALFLSWFIMGLWHGASWNFAFWGVWHACFIYAYRKLGGRFEFLGNKIRAFLGWSVTLPIIMLSWIPFRAGTLTNTFGLLKRVFDLPSYLSLGLRENIYLIVFLILVMMLLVRFATQIRWQVLERLWIKQASEIMVYGVMIFIVFIFLRPITQFIYFQF